MRRCLCLVSLLSCFAFGISRFFFREFLLTSAGNPVSGVTTKIGGKTTLVVRDTVIYAFYPKGGPSSSALPPANTIAETLQLFPNYPNPLNPFTHIDFQLPNTSWVKLEVFDIAGRKIKILLKKKLMAGHHNVKWDGTNEAGQPVASRVYFYQLRSGEFVQTRKMMLLR